MIDEAVNVPEELTARVSSVHLPRTTLQCVREGAWMFPYKVTSDSTWLALAPADDGSEVDILKQVRERGLGAAMASLVQWAIGEHKSWLVLDENAEPDDKLPLYVG
jgi:hypothetical protein